MKIAKFLLILLFCASLVSGYGCDDNSVNPERSGEQGQGPGDEGGME
jgi:hypothetical protein